MNVIFLPECLETWPIISVLVIWLSVSWSRPAIKTPQSPLSAEAKNQPVNEDFDLQGCDVLALFSIRLSNATICLQKVK